MRQIILIVVSIALYLFILCPKVSAQNFDFAEPVDYYSGDGTWHINGDDLNGDKLIDLFTANREGSVSIFFNLGGGVFQSAINIPLTTLPYWVCAADIDNDEDKDIIAANHNSTGSFTILLNDGAGNFTVGPVYRVGIYAWSVIAADIDNDGDNDIALSTEHSYRLYIFTNDGSGTFTRSGDYFTGNGSHQVVAEDLNNDNYLDFIVAGGISDYVSVLINNGDGTFQSPTTLPSGDNVISVVVSDLDNDDDKDIVSINYHGCSFLTMFNNGSGSFTPSQTFPYSSLPTHAAAADLDGDSWKELIITRQTGYSTPNILIMRNEGFGQFSPAVELYGGSAPLAVFAYDLDSDGDIDLATANLGSSDISVLLNQEITSVHQNEGNIPQSFTLYQNYPNPFNARTTIQYDLPETGQVILKIYDIIGREVATVVNEYQDAGRYQVTWDATKMATGIYFSKLQTGNHTETKKMSFLK